MDRYEEEADDSDNETDPEQLLNEWLGELDSLTVVSSSKVSFDVIFRVNRWSGRSLSLTIPEKNRSTLKVRSKRIVSEIRMSLGKTNVPTASSSRSTLLNWCQLARGLNNTTLYIRTYSRSYVQGYVYDRGTRHETRYRRRRDDILEKCDVPFIIRWAHYIFAILRRYRATVENAEPLGYAR